jgi:hypothetical protein
VGIIAFSDIGNILLLHTTGNTGRNYHDIDIGVELEDGERGLEILLNRIDFFECVHEWKG